MGSNSPEGMGEAAGKVFKDTMDGLVKALASKPAPAEAKPKVSAILDDAEKTLVALGKQREALAPAERAAFDKKLASTMQSLSSATFNKYSDVATYYRGLDLELGNLIARANTLTQYANFELLRMQSPKEAEKHGVK